MNEAYDSFDEFYLEYRETLYICNLAEVMFWSRLLGHKTVT